MGKTALRIIAAVCVPVWGLIAYNFIELMNFNLRRWGTLGALQWNWDIAIPSAMFVLSVVLTVFPKQIPPKRYKYLAITSVAAIIPFLAASGGGM